MHKETQPSFQVTALAGPPRLSIHNPPPPKSYGKNEPAWVDALSGSPADPSDHKDQHNEWRVKSTDYSIGYGSEAHHLIVPGLREDGKLVYQTLHSRRSRNRHEMGYMDNEPSHPAWWDEQMKKSTEWFIKFREDGGMQPPTAEGQEKRITDQDGNLIKDDEQAQKVLSMWSSIVIPDFEDALDKNKSSYYGGYNGGSRPHATVISKDDVSTALTSKPYHSGDGAKPPDATLSFNKNFQPDPENVIIRVKDAPRWERERNNGPTRGSSHLLIHSEYSKSFLPSTTAMLAYPANLEDLDKLSTEARTLCDGTDEDATAYMQQMIKNAGTAFDLFDKDRHHSTTIEESIFPYHNRGYQVGRLDRERRATARSNYIAASVCRAFDEQDMRNSTRSGSYIPPYVSAPSKYAWDQALKTGWIEASSLHGPPNAIEEILEDTEQRLAAHTGTGTRVEGEAPPPSYGDTIELGETGFTAPITSGLGSSISVFPSEHIDHPEPRGGPSKKEPAGYEDDDTILLGQPTAAAASSSGTRQASQYGVSHLSPTGRETITNITRVGGGGRSPGGSRHRRRSRLLSFCGNSDESSDE
ncbi:hypothetical protein L198_00046 [Cryptococcus wingfieldii CBS 7118]|uniref:Uncharacterized protein n=1 Tax=Cryptococcus wingfieldii CBS 7118 TaxID=1295528 RepID=A0A1E3K7W6_9TREE|nr:hypothetical protein L198_00046 [Cryptococcus wingfieldii CBS 7118]ODO08322.1 hypothetical protein L198_00046 [Cryptococcus wingfieldii CBS 7118]